MGLVSRRPRTYAVRVEFDAPSCPVCGTVLSDTPGAFVCVRDGYRLPYADVEMPPVFDGPSVKGG